MSPPASPPKAAARARTGRPLGTKEEAATAAAHPVVLVDGDEPALVAEAISAVVDAAVGDSDRALCLEDFRGDEVSIAAVADSCATPPFLVERRVVLVRDVGRFNTEEVAPLVAYLEDPLPTTVLVLGSGEGTTPPKLTAAVKAKGHVLSTRVAAKEAPDWLRRRVAESPVSLEPAAERALVAHLGDAYSRVGPLLDVLAAAFGEGATLSAADIEPYLGEAGSVAPWDLTDAIDRGDSEAALRAMRRLGEGGDRHPLVLLAILHRHAASLLRVDGPSIRTEAQAAAAMGIQAGRSTYPAKKALASLKRWGGDAVLDVMSLLADAELDLKGRSELPPEVVLEVLVARMCSRVRRSGSGRR